MKDTRTVDLSDLFYKDLVTKRRRQAERLLTSEPILVLMEASAAFAKSSLLLLSNSSGPWPLALLPWAMNSMIASTWPVCSNKPPNHSVNQPVSQPANHSVNQPANHSASQPASQWHSFSDYRCQELCELSGVWSSKRIV